MPYGAANFLKELARGAIDSGADMFVTTGNHNLGPIEIYDSPARGKRPIFYGLGNSSGATCRSCCPPTCSRATANCWKRWKHPEKATEYDLTAPLNQGDFAHEFTFQSVIAEARFQGNELAEVVLHPVELGYGDRLTTSGIPRLVADEAKRGKIIDQVVKQTAQFGLPTLEIGYSGTRGIIASGATRRA